jgi:hypothetical protein
MIGGVAAAAAVRTFPFRVFSFPKEIAIATIADLPDFHIRELWRSTAGGDRAYFQGAFFINKHGIYEQMPYYWRKIDEEIIIAKPIEPYPWQERATNFTTLDLGPARADLSRPSPSDSTN